jgi:hypothetical protein
VYSANQFSPYRLTIGILGERISIIVTARKMVVSYSILSLLQMVLAILFLNELILQQSSGGYALRRCELLSGALIL